jgi:hypothetical protein
VGLASTERIANINDYEMPGRLNGRSESRLSESRHWDVFTCGVGIGAHLERFTAGSAHGSLRCLPVPAGALVALINLSPFRDVWLELAAKWTKLAQEQDSDIRT